MSDWDEREPKKSDWGDLRVKALAGAGCGLVVLGWMLYARPGEEAPSARGFDLGAAAVSGRSGAGRVFAAREAKTGLDMVSSQIGSGPASVVAGSFPGAVPEREAASAPERREEAAPPAAEENRAAAPPAPADPAAEDQAALASAGIPTDAKGLDRLGGQKGLLSALAVKMLDHPKVLAAVFNNKRVVDAFMSREISRRNCQSGDALKSYLSDSNSAGMTKVFPVIQAALSRPATASALAGTEMARRVMDCPSVRALSSDPSAITAVAMSNTKALGLLTDPRVATALASNPQASGLLSGLQSKMGGAR